MCPGIITIIWSLITSDTTGSEDKDNELIDTEPDDEVTELLNNELTRDYVLKMINDDAGNSG